MMQQAYATALWYPSCTMPVSHTDENSSEAVPGNESSATTASFSKSKHARSVETAKDCLATVSNNRTNGLVTVELSASNSIIAERSNDSGIDSVIAECSASDSEIAERNNNSARGSVIAQRSASASVSAITESFGNKSKHARSSETAKDCSATVSKISVNGSVIAACSASDLVIAECSNESTRSLVITQCSASDAVSAITESLVSKTSVKSTNKASTARQSYASCKTTVYIVMVRHTSLAIEVWGDLPGITNEDCTDTGATTEQWGDFCTVFPVQLDKTQQQCSVQLQKWRTIHSEKTAHHNASAKLEGVLGKLQQMFADNAEAEASRKSAEKERCTVEQTEHQVAQAAQQAILHDIDTALDSISKHVTAIEETHQRDKITKIETQMLQQQQAMQHYERDALNIQTGEQEPVQQHAEVFQRLHTLEKAGQQQLENQWTETKEQDKTAPTIHNIREVQQQNPPSATDTDTVSVPTRAQHKRDEVDAPEKVAAGKVNAVTENDYMREHRATGADAETETTGAHSKTGEMNADAETFRNKGICIPTEDTQLHPAGNTAVCSLDYSKLLGIMKQMQTSTTVQATLAHEQSEKLENKLSELTTKLDEVTQVMEKQQFELTCRTKVTENQVDINMKKLERVDGGEIETDKVDQT